MDYEDKLRMLAGKLDPEVMSMLREAGVMVMKFVTSEPQYNRGNVSWIIEPMVQKGYPRIVAASVLLILQLDGKLDITDDGWFSVKEVAVA